MIVHDMDYQRGLLRLVPVRSHDEDDAMATTFSSRYVSFFPIISTAQDSWFGIRSESARCIHCNDGNAATATYMKPAIAAVDVAYYKYQPDHDVLASDIDPLRITSKLHLTLTH